MSAVLEPHVSRSVTLHLKGDWGMANLHRVCGWLSQELIDRSGPHTRTAIWSAKGALDSVRAVGRGEVDIALATPASFVTGALTGLPPYTREHYPNLRALGVVPQRDRLVVAVDAALGITSMAQLRERRPALRVATAAHDGASFIGLGAHELLAHSGVDVLGWGGRFVTDERPWAAFEQIRAGHANAIVQEAIMLPPWQEIGRQLTFLPIEDAVLTALEAEFGWRQATVPAGHFPNCARFRTLDFSDFLVLTRTDLPEDVAYALAWILGETRDKLERQYRHIPPERSPVTYPLDPVRMGQTPVPLHDGAAAYYQAKAGCRV